MLTPDGRIARYFFGLEFSPRDLRLGLVETTQRKIGNVVDQVLLFCFHYDPAMGRYSAVALNSVRVAGALTVLALVGLIGGALLREGSRRRAERHGASAGWSAGFPGFPSARRPGRATSMLSAGPSSASACSSRCRSPSRW